MAASVQQSRNAINLEAAPSEYNISLATLEPTHGNDPGYKPMVQQRPGGRGIAPRLNTRPSLYPGSFPCVAPARQRNVVVQKGAGFEVDRVAEIVDRLQAHPVGCPSFVAYFLSAA